ncbi:P-loop containing nucleoside triphosphate hydrolase protein [Trichoderma citrinoviride]|uniref:P-loop containing nucleoside triphosphate hydrolase protein n=1 Tax=Trichoderma citrinoviride TaxID=58853 RepID=A0A2T4B975_9HYPO|nr:P-loop containing nucleoside triphosphate hydrolase protein [Trichoderma citrinoviride]PTB65883.1 P-loop containing nucleoside triphosphate hydrolase protein [Trichoderma citrinoviride]
MSAECPRFETAKDRVLWELHRLEGMDAVIELLDNINNRNRLLCIQGAIVPEQRLHTVILGNTGRGKTSAGQLFGQYMRCTSMVGSNTYKEVTGSKLLRMGPKRIEQLFRPPPVDATVRRRRLLAINDMRPTQNPAIDVNDPANFTLNRGCLHRGGVLFIDDADQLVGSHAGRAGQIILHILQEAMDTLIGDLLIVFAGCEEEMKPLFEQNPALKARIPHIVRLEEFSGSQMLGMLLDLIDERFQGKMTAEGDLDGEFMQAAVRQVGRGRGEKGFGNAYAVKNLLDEICARQAKRVCAKYDLRDVSPGRDVLFHLIKEDILGPDS